MKLASVIAAALLVALPLNAARAAPIVILDTTDVAATHAGGDYGAFSSANFADALRNGRHWGDEVADPAARFDTTQMTIDRNYNTNTVSIVMRTMFNGNDVPTGTKYADLFISSNATAFGSTPNYAIALGSQTMAADVYTVGSYQTSNDIWSSRTQYVYGGYAQPNPTAADFNPAIAYAAPVRLTAGTALDNMMVTVTRTMIDANFFDVAVLITATDNIALFDNFAIFWGTGDCSNDAIAGVVAAVPAPGAVPLLGMGFLGLALVTFRRRRG